LFKEFVRHEVIELESILGREYSLETGKKHCHLVIRSSEQMFGTRASQRRMLHSYGLCTNRAIVVNTWRAQMCKDNEVDYQIHDSVGLETLMHIFLYA
jgi:hypothetical protein